MTDPIVRWEEPPKLPPNAGNRNGAKYMQVAATLRAEPGRWAVVRDGPDLKRGTAYTYAHYIRQGRSDWAPAGAFESVAREVDGAYVVYARYVGEVAS